METNDTERSQKRRNGYENEQSVIVPIEEADPSLHVEYELLPRKPGLKKANRKGKNAETGHSSLYRGVYNRGNKWNAQIQVDGRKIYLGTFDSEWKAAKKYDEAALELHGDRARLNFPLEAPIVSTQSDDLYPEASPVHLVSSPVHLVSSPVHLVSSPVHLVSSPVHLISSPVHLVSSPVHLISSPTHPISSPPPEPSAFDDLIFNLSYPSSPLLQREMTSGLLTAVVLIPKEESQEEIQENRHYIERSFP